MSSRESSLSDVESQADARLARFTVERAKAEQLLEELGTEVSFSRLKSEVGRLALEQPWPLTAALLAVARSTEVPSHAVNLARLALVTAWRVCLPETSRRALFLEAEALLGDGLRRLNRHRDAERAFRRAALHQGHVIDPYLCGLYCGLLAKLREDQGRSEEALALLQRAVSLFEEIGQVDDEAQALLDKASLELRRDTAERSLADLQAAIRLIDKGLSADLAAVAIGAYGIALRGFGRIAEAVVLLDAFWDHYPDFGTPAERAELCLLEGMLLMYSDRWAVAEAKLEVARREFLLAGEPKPAMEASLSLAVLLLQDVAREDDLKRLVAESLRPLADALSMPEPARVALLKFCAAVESGTATASAASALLEVAGFMSEAETTVQARTTKGKRK